MTERVTQQVVEVLRVPADTKVRVTQEVIEVLRKTAAPVKTSQPLVIVIAG